MSDQQIDKETYRMGYSDGAKAMQGRIVAWLTLKGYSVAAIEALNATLPPIQSRDTMTIEGATPKGTA